MNAYALFCNNVVAIVCTKNFFERIYQNNGWAHFAVANVYFVFKGRNARHMACCIFACHVFKLNKMLCSVVIAFAFNNVYSAWFFANHISTCKHNVIACIAKTLLNKPIVCPWCFKLFLAVTAVKIVVDKWFGNNYAKCQNNNNNH